MVINNSIIIQFGTSSAKGSTTQITLPLSYSNTNYNAIACIRKYSDPAGSIQSVCVAPYSNSILGAFMDYYQTNVTLPFSWLTIGY